MGGHSRDSVANLAETLYKAPQRLPFLLLDGVEVGDIAYIPACPATGNKPLRARIDLPRPYPDGLQCDLESGNQQVDTPGQ